MNFIQINSDSQDIEFTGNYNSPFIKLNSSSSKNITVTFGENVTRVPAYMFYGGNGNYVYGAPKSYVSKVYFSNGITSIGKYAFSECVQKTSIDLPKNLKTIGSGAFAYCKLSSIIINSDIDDSEYDCENSPFYTEQHPIC